MTNASLTKLAYLKLKGFIKKINANIEANEKNLKDTLPESEFLYVVSEELYEGMQELIG
jgi:hypothetical protein